MKTCKSCHWIKITREAWYCEHPYCTNPVTGEKEAGLAAWSRALWCVDGKHWTETPKVGAPHASPQDVGKS